ncbi:MAG: SIMPL domain-containing protein [Spirosomataceae bacterium]
MKKLSILLGIIGFMSLFPALRPFAQTMNPSSEPIKKIEVTGTAELEVVPDELYFNISLKEYYQDEKNQKNKVTIDLLEKQLVDAVREAGLAKEDLSVGGVGGYRNWFGRKKPQTFLENKQYVLKVSNLYKIDGILSKVDEKGIEYANIGRVDHSKKTELRKQVKINALKAAKEKATYLLESIGEKVGDVLEIKELEDNFYMPSYPMMAQSNMRMASMDAAPVGDSSLEYQKIKITYRMEATFRIK